MCPSKSGLKVAIPFQQAINKHSVPTTRGAPTVSNVMHAFFTMHDMFSKHVILLLLLSFFLSPISAAPAKPSSEKLSTATRQLNRELEKAASRVINGQPVTDKAEYPFVVDLSLHSVAISSTRFCTGTLLASNIVLTAAHCVLNDGYRSGVYATVGRIELDDKHVDNEHAQTFRAVASIVHPEYQGLGSPNDVALMLLNGSSEAPTVHLANSSPKTDDVAWVVGYGIQMMGTVETSSRPVAVMSGRLQKTALRIKDKEFCSNPEMGMETAPGMLCTAGVKKDSSACRGDSGGGLFLRKKGLVFGRNKHENVVQVGIVSYGDAQCSSETSGVFTDVASVKEWIRSSMERLQRAFSPVDRQLTGNTTRAIDFPGSANWTLSRSIENRNSIIKYYYLHDN